jgi:hypothetical protein
MEQKEKEFLQLFDQDKIEVDVPWIKNLIVCSKPYGPI